MAAKVIALTPGHFHSIADDIIETHGRTIGAIGYAIYGYLCYRRNRKTGRCDPSIDTIAKAFKLGRTAVKDYLRKLRDVGLLEKEPRTDPAGDPTSNQYNLLDPSPAAIEKRRLASEAAAACERGRSPHDPPPSEQGRSSDDSPSVVSRLTGRSSDDPEPNLFLQPEETNQREYADAQKNVEQTLQMTSPHRALCTHSVEERSYYGDVAICRHCWTLFDSQETAMGHALGVEGGQAHAASAA
jgi:hypothetical protein